MHERFVSANGLRIHCVEAGEGSLVLLLHGFPEFSYGWRRQIATLAAAGLRVVAPDLRGYNETTRPRGVAQYRLSLLMEDVVRLAEALGETRVALVGHDWGGVIAWYTSMHHPSLVRRLVILNAPHPAAYRRELRRLTSQVWRSAYAAFFQLPWIPEALLRARGFSLLKRGLGGAARHVDELERYIAAFSPPYALTAALNYYRAALRYPPPDCLRIAVPTLIVWGNRDPFLVPALADGLDAWVDHLTVERLPEASHWLHHEAPDLVAEKLVAFLR